MKKTVYGLITVLFSSIIILLISELLLRFLLPSFKQFYIKQPNQEYRVEINSNKYKLIDIDSIYTIKTNAQGIISFGEFKNNGLNILTVGGSTTENILIDQKNSWQSMLQNVYSKNVGDIWVGNAGKRALNSHHHKMQLKYLLPQFNDVDVVIILVGFNDMVEVLLNNEYLNLDEEQVLYKAFSQISFKNNLGCFIKRSILWELLANTKDKLFPSKEISNLAEFIDNGRITRKKSTIINEMPDLNKYLNKYEENINAFIDIAKENKVQIVFMTQPTIYNTGMNESQRDMVSFGKKGKVGNEYYAINILKSVIDSFNYSLTSVCQNRNIQIIDLCRYLPKDTSIFFDDCHFNRGGNKEVANIIYEHLINNDVLLGSY